MGLEEKRKLKELQDKLPALQSKIDGVAGTPVPVEVDWASFGSDGAALNSFENSVFNPLGEALKAICKDDIGKTAVKESLKKVVVKHSAERNKLSATMSGGVLTLEENFGSGGYVNSTKIKSAIESGL